MKNSLGVYGVWCLEGGGPCMCFVSLFVTSRILVGDVLPGLRQQSRPSFRAKTLLTSRDIIAGNRRSIETTLRLVRRAAWKQKARRAGMGMRAAERKAAILHTAVVVTDTPALRRTSPTWSCKEMTTVRERRSVNLLVQEHGH